ncbi:MAG: hypothetical protein ACYDG4_04225 [Desulfuromonadaceae bacterium]
MKKFIFLTSLFTFAFMYVPSAYAVRHVLVIDPLTPYQRAAFVSDMNQYGNAYKAGVSIPSRGLNSVGSAYRPIDFKPKNGVPSAVLQVLENGVGRWGALAISKATPYVGTALMAYALYSDLRDAVEASPESIAENPKLHDALTATQELPDVLNLPMNSQVGTDFTSDSSSPFNFGEVRKTTYIGVTAMTPNYPGYPPKSIFTTTSSPQIATVYTYIGKGTWNAGMYMYNDNFACYRYETAVIPPILPRPATDEEVFASFGNYNALNDPAYMAELEKLFEAENLPMEYSPALEPLKPQISEDLQLAEATAQALADNTAALAANTAAAQAASNATSTAQDVRDNAQAQLALNPTDPALIKALQDAQLAYDSQVLEQAKLEAELARLQAEKSEEEALIAPPLPSNEYDPLITPPDKKDIPGLLGSFVGSSPLVSMVRSFTVATDSASCSVPIGNVYGQELSFDFCRWQPVLMGCGGVFIILIQGFSILVVIRGW